MSNAGIEDRPADAERAASGPSTAEGQEDRRASPRRSTQLRVVADGVKLTAVNVSRRGMQLSCPALLFGLLQPSVDAGPVSLEIDLPEGSTTILPARIVYAAHYRYEYLVGVCFTVTAGEAYQAFLRGCVPDEPAAAPADP
jgi:hypothetical protein